MDIELASWPETADHAALPDDLPDLAGRDLARQPKSDWKPALDLVEVASQKFADYEQRLSRLCEAADRKALQAEAEKRRLMQRIDELSVMLQDSHANYERTLVLLASSSKLCAQQTAELRVMTETLAEAKDNTSEITALIQYLHAIIAQATPAALRRVPAVG